MGALMAGADEEEYGREHGREGADEREMGGKDGNSEKEDEAEGGEEGEEGEEEEGGGFREEEMMEGGEMHAHSSDAPPSISTGTNASPPVALLRLPGVLSSIECAALIDYCHDHGLQTKSDSVDGQVERIVNSDRMHSEHAICIANTPYA
jgi:hypothetical protein